MTPAARPLYLDLSPDPVFGIFHAPAPSSANGTAVLLCPPWGWNDITSYRARRTWAERLAEAGHPTLRFDFPGAGDSGGSPGDPGRVDAWTAAVAAAVAWLRSLEGCRRVALIGLGLGGLIGARAIADGARVDDLVLWAVPSKGRNILREERAFAGLQTSRYSVTGESEPPLLPADWLEVGGFVLSAETIESIEGLAFGPLREGAPRHALLLERDGIAPDNAIRTALEQVGADVTIAPGDGWGAMCFHPERYDPPLDVMTRVTAWLAGAAAGEASPVDEPVSGVVPVVRDDAEINVGGVVIRETPLIRTTPGGRMFGVLAEPPRDASSAEPAPIVAVFLNSGAVRRIGPNRIWVEAARHWAARGIPTLRIDVDGIGDSDGDARRYIHVGQFYRQEINDEVGAFLDALEARGLGSRFVLIGLCSGAYWAFHRAAVDTRVTAVFLLNPRALSWDSEFERRREARKLEQLLEPGTWRRILRRQSPRPSSRALRQAVGSGLRLGAASLSQRIRDRRRGDSHEDRVAATLDRLRANDARVLLAFSDDEPLEEELKDHGIMRRAASWPNLTLARLPGRDHTLRPIVAQRAAKELLDRALEETLARIPGGASGHPETPRHV